MACTVRTVKVSTLFPNGNLAPLGHHSRSIWRVISPDQRTDPFAKARILIINIMIIQKPGDLTMGELNQYKAASASQDPKHVVRNVAKTFPCE
jgi:hypothetical protein